MKGYEGVRFLNERFERALILEGPDPSLDAYLRAQGIEPERVPKEMTDDIEGILARLERGQHDLLYKRSKFPVDARVLDASSNLAAVMMCCIGDDSVDKEACAERGVLVMNDPISNGRSVVELVFGEMITLARRIYAANDETHKNVWAKNNKRRYELKGKTLTILGLGNIGKAVAQMGEAFGMNICFWDDAEVPREVGRALGWTACDTIEEAMREGDFVTVHVSSVDAKGASNRGMLTYERLALLGASRGENSPKIFINAGRGFLLEPGDLLRAVREGHISCAAVDVFPEEPGSGADAWESPFADEPRIVTTPHIGAATQEAQPRIASYVAATTRAFSTQGAVRSCTFSPGKTIGVNTERASHVLAVTHSDARGTKKAINDAIFDAGLHNLESAHRDFTQFGFAYDVSALNGLLTQDQLSGLVDAARAISGDKTAIRAIRQITL